MKSIKETLLKYYPNAEKELSKEKLRMVYAAMIDLSDAVATERVKNISSKQVVSGSVCKNCGNNKFHNGVLQEKICTNCGNILQTDR